MLQVPPPLLPDSGGLSQAGWRELGGLGGLPKPTCPLNPQSLFGAVDSDTWVFCPMPRLVLHRRGGGVTGTVQWCKRSWEASRAARQSLPIPLASPYLQNPAPRGAGSIPVPPLPVAGLWVLPWEQPRARGCAGTSAKPWLFPCRIGAGWCWGGGGSSATGRGLRG